MTDAGVAAPSLGGRTTHAHGARDRRVWLAVAVLVVVLPHAPGLTTDFGRSLLTQMGIAIVFALSYNVLFGETGLLSFGHAVYFGLGGYAAIHCMRAINHGLPLPMPFVPLAGAAGGLVCGLAFGALTTRRAGTIFALISLGVGELVYAATFLLPGLFGGEEGITASRTRALALPGLDLGSQLQVYYVVAAWALVSAAAMRAFTRTPVGRLCNAVRDNPERVQFVGYDPQRIRFIAFAVAGLFAGVAGGLHALNYEIVAADAVGAQRSGSVLVMAYMGGTGSFAGPVVGAIVLTWLETSLSAYTSAWLLYVGLIFIAIILFAPAGLWGIVAMHAPILHTRALRRVLARYAVALLPGAIMVAGAAALIEMSYRLSTQRELGSVVKLGPLALDASTPVPWIAGAAMLVGGLVLLRISARFVAVAWQAATLEARGGGAP
ncbi:MAG TPA: branched-chain amino acid ABC transporter permease [Casimicrobiaceae bacterium]|nr:branched-chain amino acid ABC transporter permease [Casimicrobiaceae bacterium]